MWIIRDVQELSVWLEMSMICICMYKEQHAMDKCEINGIYLWKVLNFAIRKWQICYFNLKVN